MKTRLQYQPAQAIRDAHAFGAVELGEHHTLWNADHLGPCGFDKGTCVITDNRTHSAFEVEGPEDPRLVALLQDAARH